MTVQPTPTSLITPAQWATIHDLTAWLDRKNGRSQEEVSFRLLKLTEEAGEVAQAWIGVTGRNPRKGVTHTRTDVADELCDVIVAAAIGLSSLIDHPAEHLNSKIELIVSRAHSATP